MRLKLIYIAPLIVFLLFVGVFARLLLTPDRDASKRPSVLIGQIVPDISLEGLYEGSADLSDEDLKTGKPVVINFFASWCVPCRAEHESLMRLSGEHGATIIGIAYMNKREDAQAFLSQLGNPYSKMAFDPSGRTGIDFGVIAVPETFIIDGDGVIKYRHLGPIVGQALEARVLPVLQELRK